VTRSPDALVIADDTHGRYFRHDLFPKYKSEKTPVPDPNGGIKVKQAAE
jgi:hypothetical protein